MTEISAALVKELRDADRSGDDGLQAGAPGDRRRHRRRADAPSREGDGGCGQARRPRDDRGHRARRRVEGAAAIVGVGCETEPVSKNEAFREFAEKALAARLGERRRRRCGRGARGRARRADRRSSARTSSSSTARVSRGGTLARTSIRPRTRSACSSSSRAAPPTSRARSRCTSRSRRPSTRRATTCRRTCSPRSGRSTSTRTRCSRSPSRRARRSSRACSRSGSLRRAPGGALLEQAWIHEVSKTVRAVLEEGRIHQGVLADLGRWVADDPPRGARRTAAADRRVRACAPQALGRKPDGRPGVRRRPADGYSDRARGRHRPAGGHRDRRRRRRRELLSGHDGRAEGMDRATADYAGMLATLLNALALQDALDAWARRRACSRP